MEMKFDFQHVQFKDDEGRPLPQRSWTKSTAMICGVTTATVRDEADHLLFQGTAECSAKDSYNKRAGRLHALLDATKDCDRFRRREVFKWYEWKRTAPKRRAKAATGGDPR